MKRFFFVGRDMTESRRAQQTLRESEQLARGIIDTALDAFVQMDEQGVISDWNTQAEKIFGWTHAEAVGTKLSELIIPDIHRDAHQAGMERFLRTGEARILGRRFEIEAIRRDGKEIKVELSVTELTAPQRLRVQRLHARPHRQDRGRGPHPAGREDGGRRPAHRRHRA